MFGRGGQLCGAAPLQPLAALPLPTLVPRLPEHLPLQAGGQVLLGHPVLGVGVGVAVPHPIAEGLAVAVGIAQVGRHRLAAAGLHGFEGIEEPQEAVALFGAGQVEGRLGQGVKPLRQPHPFKRRRAGLHHHHRLGVRQADVLPGGDQHAPEDEAGVFTRLHHARQPEQGRIGIAAAQRFDEGADGVEVGVALLVVEHRPLLDRVFGDGQVDPDHAIAIGRGGFHRQFQGVEQAAGVAARHIHQVVGGLGADRHGPLAVAPLRILQGPLQQLVQVLRLQGLQAKQARAAHQRLVHLKEGVFGGGPDQGHGAVLHPGQQRILLGAVEAVHLIDEQQRAQAVLLQALLGRLHRGAQIFHPRQHGVEAAEVGAGGGGDDPRQGGFAHPRRPIHDQVAHPIGADGPAQQSPGAEDLLLPGKVIEAAGAQAIRQGRQALAQLFAVVAEQIAHAGCRGLVIN